MSAKLAARNGRKAEQHRAAEARQAGAGVRMRVDSAQKAAKICNLTAGQARSGPRYATLQSVNP